MLKVFKDLYNYRELLMTLAWKEISVRYKQAYFGLAWSVLKPVMLMLIFTMVRSFIGIESGDIPYPILTFAALMPWIFFQEAVSVGVGSIVGNAVLIRKIYFPREVFPIASVMTKLVELVINIFILAGLMMYYQMAPTAYVLWAPLLFLYTICAALTVTLAASALNVYFRDINHLLPVAISLMMYASPVVYPLSLVKRTLLTNQAAGPFSDLLYFLYTVNPLVGIIDAFQCAVLRGTSPDFTVVLPGFVLVACLLPFSHGYFKRSEARFADII